MFYGYEKTFQSIEHLEQAIVDYINYYNNKRIKIKLKTTATSIIGELGDIRRFHSANQINALSALTSDTMNLGISSQGTYHQTWESLCQKDSL